MYKYFFTILTIFLSSQIISQNIDYNNEIQPIFDNSCMPCHEGGNPSSGLDLSSYENVMAGSNSGPVIIAGDYENSILWQEVQSGDMPNNVANGALGIPDLTQAEINLIENWILDLQCMTTLCEEGYECIMGDCICIDDFDNDEICDENDNCPNNWNPDQIDSDSDGIGDECDPMPLSIHEININKEIVKTITILGKETQKQKGQTLIHIYEDGTIDKIHPIK